MKDKKNKKDKKDKKKKKEKTVEVLEKAEVVSQEGKKPKKSIEVASQGWVYLPITMESWFKEGEAIADEVLHRK